MPCTSSPPLTWMLEGLSSGGDLWEDTSDACFFAPACAPSSWHEDWGLLPVWPKYVLPILSVNAFWFLAWDHVYCVLLLAVLLGVNHTDLIAKPALMLSDRILAHDPSNYRPPTHLNCHCVDLVRSRNILDFVLYSSSGCWTLLSGPGWFVWCPPSSAMKKRYLPLFSLYLSWLFPVSCTILEHQMQRHPLFDVSRYNPIKVMSSVLLVVSRYHHWIT